MTFAIIAVVVLVVIVLFVMMSKKPADGGGPASQKKLESTKPAAKSLSRCPTPRPSLGNTEQRFAHLLNRLAEPWTHTRSGLTRFMRRLRWAWALMAC